MWWTFGLLLSLAFLISGGTGYVIFAPLTFQHQIDRNRHNSKITTSLSWAFAAWLWFGRYRQMNDPQLNALAVPAHIMLWCMLLGATGTLFCYITKGTFYG